MTFFTTFLSSIFYYYKKYYVLTTFYLFCFYTFCSAGIITRVTFLTIFKIQIPDENLSFYNYYGTMMIDYFIKQNKCLYYTSSCQSNQKLKHSYYDNYFSVINLRVHEWFKLLFWKNCPCNHLKFFPYSEKKYMELSWNIKANLRLNKL